MTTQSVAALVVLAALPLAALGLGADHPPGKFDPKSFPHWPAGAIDLVNSAPRVGGYWYNQWDGFFYAGDAAALNRFLAAYAKLPAVSHAVVLHAGRAPLTGPLGGKPPTVKYNWSVHVYLSGWGTGEPARPADAPAGYAVTVHVFVGESLPLDKLDVPKNVTVTSAGDVEEFVRKRAAGK